MYISHLANANAFFVLIELRLHLNDESMLLLLRFFVEVYTRGRVSWFENKKETLVFVTVLVRLFSSCLLWQLTGCLGDDSWIECPFFLYYYYYYFSFYPPNSTGGPLWQCALNILKRCGCRLRRELLIAMETALLLFSWLNPWLNLLCIHDFDRRWHFRRLTWDYALSSVLVCFLFCLRVLFRDG